jgi:tRNA(adenine34) deaminase
MKPFDDAYFMKRALVEAEAAFDRGEVPIGAVIVIKRLLMM